MLESHLKDFKAVDTYQKPSALKLRSSIQPYLGVAKANSYDQIALTPLQKYHSIDQWGYWARQVASGWGGDVRARPRDLWPLPIVEDVRRKKVRRCRRFLIVRLEIGSR